MAIERHDRPRAAAEIELGSHVRQRVSAAEDRAFEQHQHDAEQRREDRSKGGQNSAHNAESGTSPEHAQALSCSFSVQRSGAAMAIALKRGFLEVRKTVEKALVGVSQNA